MGHLNKGGIPLLHDHFNRIIFVYREQMQNGEN